MTTTTITTVEQAAEHVRHLVGSDADGVLPYATAGHYDPSDAAASPVVATIYSESVTSLTHPYNGRPAALVVMADESELIVAVDRIAHPRGCAACEPTWERYDAVLANIPAGAMVSAVGEIETNLGPKQLLVDAEDLEGLDEEGADV
jgi:hypothetical protein